MFERVVESNLLENTAHARYSYYDSASPFGISPANYTFMDYTYDNNVLLTSAMNTLSLTMISIIVGDICPFAGAAMSMATALYGLAQAYNITTYGLSYRADRFNCNNPPVLTCRIVKHVGERSGQGTPLGKANGAASSVCC